MTRATLFWTVVGLLSVLIVTQTASLKSDKRVSQISWAVAGFFVALLAAILVLANLRS